MKSNRNAVVRGSKLIEILENRQMLSAAVVQTGNTLTITGDAAAQTVQIFDSYDIGIKTTVVSVDGDGNGLFTDPGDYNAVAFTGVNALDIRLAGGADKVQVTLADPYEAASKQFNIRTGGGNDLVTFSNPIGNSIRNSSVNLTVRTGAGVDRVRFDFGQFSSANLVADVGTGDGNDVLKVVGGGFVGNSTVEVRADMGLGDDKGKALLDWDMFDVLGLPTSTLRLNYLGGEGNDLLQVTGELGNTAANVFGVLDLNLDGQNGNDTINAALDRFNVNGGTLKLRESGGAGNDSLALSGSIQTSSSGGTLDVVLAGGEGDDVLTSATNASALHQYAGGAAVLDGEAGTDQVTASGTLQTVSQNNE